MNKIWSTQTSIAFTLFYINNNNNNKKIKKNKYSTKQNITNTKEIKTSHKSLHSTFCILKVIPRIGMKCVHEYIHAHILFFGELGLMHLPLKSMIKIEIKNNPLWLVGREMEEEM